LVACERHFTKIVRIINVVINIVAIMYLYSSRVSKKQNTILSCRVLTDVCTYARNVVYVFKYPTCCCSRRRPFRLKRKAAKKKCQHENEFNLSKQKKRYHTLTHTAIIRPIGNLWVLCYAREKITSWPTANTSCTGWKKIIITKLRGGIFRANELRKY